MRSSVTRASSSRSGVWAPALFVLLWSTGFVGARLGLPHADPFTFLGLRLAVAGVLLAGLALLLHGQRLARPSQYAHTALVGLLLHAGYLGGVFWAISKGVPAGVSAVVVGLQPVLTAVLAGRLLAERLQPRQWAGLVLGVVGVLLVVAPGLSAAAGIALPMSGLAACVVGLVSGTAGTLHQKRHGQDVPLLWGATVQYAAASAALLALAVTTEPLRMDWTGELVVAFVWLVLVLSLGAVLLLLVLLRRGTASSVSSLLYLVPPATALEAYLLFGERLAPWSLVGMAVAAAGVALVVRPAPRAPAPAPAPAQAGPVAPGPSS